MFYCSSFCYNQSKNQKISINCLQCSLSFYKYPRQLNKEGRDFCSRSCSALSNNKIRSEGGSVSKRAKPRICGHCTRIYYTSGNHRSKKYCQECFLAKPTFKITPRKDPKPRKPREHKQRLVEPIREYPLNNEHSKYSEQNLKMIVEDSFSKASCLRKLNILPSGGNYKMLDKYIKSYNIDISHFSGAGWSKNLALDYKKKNIEDYLNNKSPIASCKLRQKLLKEGYFQEICSSCGLWEWLGSKIPLELDHIDGNNEDNSLSNLRLLCPNCHALTPTWRGRNIGSQRGPRTPTPD